MSLEHKVRQIIKRTSVDGDGNSGGVASDAEIAAWAGNPDDLYTGALTLDENGAKVSAAVAWPDGATGAYFATAINVDYPSVVDAYTITHVLSGTTKTATQSAVTRDAAGVVIVYPPIAVA